VRESRSHPEHPCCRLPCTAQWQGLQPTAPAIMGGLVLSWRALRRHRISASWKCRYSLPKSQSHLRAEDGGRMQIIRQCLSAVFMQPPANAHSTQSQHRMNRSFLPSDRSCQQSNSRIGILCNLQDVCHCIGLVLERCQKKRLPTKFRVYFFIPHYHYLHSSTI